MRLHAQLYSVYDENGLCSQYGRGYTICQLFYFSSVLLRCLHIKFDLNRLDYD